MTSTRWVDMGSNSGVLIRVLMLRDSRENSAGRERVMGTAFVTDCYMDFSGSWFMI